MLERISDSRWQYSMLHPVVQGRCSSAQYNRDMNILFIKLHLLDPTTVMMAYHMLQKGMGIWSLCLSLYRVYGYRVDDNELKWQNVGVLLNWDCSRRVWVFEN